MCGIIGYIGKDSAARIILVGLKKLEYRGYDSAGIVTINSGRLSLLKRKGKIIDLEESFKKKGLIGMIGIGHTRWATHGKPSNINAHPHTDCSGNIAVVHNGIVENFDDIRRELRSSGCVFKSETDTEVIAHLIGKLYQGDLKEAVRNALRRLKGSYALGVICTYEPDRIVVAKLDSPLIIGLGKDENFITSDTSAVVDYTRDVVYLNDNEIAVVLKNSFEVFDLKGKRVKKNVEKSFSEKAYIQKEKFKDFMLMEINEQPQVLNELLSRYVKPSGKIEFEKLRSYRNFLKDIKNIIIVACGTAYYAGLVGKYSIERLARIPVEVDVGSEFRYRKPIIRDKTLIVAISQSGETADTLAAVRNARGNNAKVFSICNVFGSSLARESDAVIYTYAGKETSVASTKAYTAQLMVIYLLGLFLSDLKRSLNKRLIEKYINILKRVPRQQKQIIRNSKKIKVIANRHLNFGAFLYLGRNINFPTALEGALKLKEISYIPAEGYPAGEMKHGPIALIDEYRAVVCIANNSSVYNKMISNIQEILARKGKIVVIATSGNLHIRDYAGEVIFIPKIEEVFSPMLTVVPLQLFAYYMAILKGYDVDKPRNLAKSVTVE